MYMYICMYVCVYIGVDPIYIYRYRYRYTSGLTRCICLYINIYIQVHIYIYMFICTCKYIHDLYLRSQRQHTQVHMVTFFLNEQALVCLSNRKIVDASRACALH